MKAKIEALLVEDNENDAELALRAFKKNNLADKVHLARDGVEALDFIFGNEGSGNVFIPKVILLDLKLPKINGLEVLAKLKGDKRTKGIPVVIVTSSQETRDVVECYALGANSYIVKPVEYENFINALTEVALYWIVINTTIR